MASIFLERVKLRLAALTVAIVVSAHSYAYSGVSVAGLVTETGQDKRPTVTTPVQVDNDPQLPVVITEAQVGVGEPYDITARFNPFSRPPKMVRMLTFTLKLKNQGDRPVTGFKFAIQSPLFGNSAGGLHGKESSLMGNEEVSITFEACCLKSTLIRSRELPYSFCNWAKLHS